jgi:protein involved in ribonucleotide reduction
LIVVYDSAMGKTERFVMKTGFNIVKIEDGLIVDEPFVLVTYTIGTHAQGPAKVPRKTLKFLEQNHHNLLGVAASGHMNWGKDRYAKAADAVANEYNVPIIHKFEMSGYPSDVDKFKEGVLRLYGESNIS